MMTLVDVTNWWHNMLTQSDETGEWRKVMNKLITQSDDKIDDTKWGPKVISQRDDKI